jgi:hypothetical protein
MAREAQGRVAKRASARDRFAKDIHLFFLRVFRPITARKIDVQLRAKDSFLFVFHR